MNIGALYFSLRGGIDRKTFLISYGILFVILTGVNLGGRAVPAINLLAGLVSLALLYPRICVFGKRLHDIGLSAWLQLIYFCVAFCVATYGMVHAMGGPFGQLMEAISSGADQQAAQADFQTAMQDAVKADPIASHMQWIMYGILAVWVAFLGLTPGKKGENKYAE